MYRVKKNVESRRRNLLDRGRKANGNQQQVSRAQNRDILRWSSASPAGDTDVYKGRNAERVWIYRVRRDRLEQSKNL